MESKSDLPHRALQGSKKLTHSMNMSEPERFNICYKKMYVLEFLKNSMLYRHLLEGTLQFRFRFAMKSGIRGCLILRELMWPWSPTAFKDIVHTKHRKPNKTGIAIRKALVFESFDCFDSLEFTSFEFKHSIN